MISDFFKGFWTYMTTIEWWQALIVIFIIVFTIVVGKFWRNVLIWFGNKWFGDDSTLQYRMFWGLTNDAINIQMKEEILRSFKENGFCELSGNNFAQYAKNQNKIVTSILKNHIINLYPISKSGLKVNMDDVLNYISIKEAYIEDIIFEIYIEAKRIKNYNDELITSIDAKFEKEIDNYIKRKKSETDCKTCLAVLFGKREIAENKKSKIKTFPAQKNFAEQKLSEIHSDLITFFSEKMNEKKRKGL
ncbi:MAG: hypothetical protein ACOC1O_04545 [bacterium]